MLLALAVTIFARTCSASSSCNGSLSRFFHQFVYDFGRRRRKHRLGNDACSLDCTGTSENGRKGVQLTGSGQERMKRKT